MSEGWAIHACDVRLRNLSQVDGYKVLVPLLIKEMESRVVNPFWCDSSDGGDSSVELASDDDETNFTNNALIDRSENDNMKNKSVTLGSFEEVLNSIKFSPSKKAVNQDAIKDSDPVSPSKKAVNKDAIKDSDPISPPNTKDKVNRDAIKDSDPVIPPNVKDKVNRDAIKESDLVVTTNVKVGVNHDAIKQSDIVLEKIDRDKVFDSESSDVDSDDDSIEFVGETASKMPKLLESVVRSRSPSSDVMEITSDTEFVNLAISDDPNDDTRWELNKDTGKYQELGSNPKGFKLKKMAVRVKEEHDYNKYLATGPVKVRVKMRNVRKQLGMLNKALDESIIVETRTETSHPFICPFYCPVYNVPCDAMFRVTDQQFFIEHVSNRNCPYAPRAVSPVEPMVKCEKCGDDIPESKLKEHMDDNHHTHTCPGCKDKFECKIDVEDHIINEHATHFMSNLPIIYRNKRKEPPPPPPPEEVKTYPSPAQVQQIPTNTKQHLQTIAPQPPVGHKIQLAPMPTPSNGMLGKSIVPQGVITSVNNIRLVAPPGQGVVTSASGQRVMFIQQPPQQQIVSTQSGQRIVVNNGQIRTSAGQLLQISPGLAKQLANHSQPAPPPPPAPTPVILPNSAKLQQLKLPSGQLVWAQPVASEPIPGSDKAKIQFKIIGPVAPPKVPGVIQINPHNPHAPTTSVTGPSRVPMVPTTPTSTLPYRPIVPKVVALPTAPDPKVLGLKPVRVAQPLQLLHVDKDGAPVYQHNSFQSSNIQLGVPVGQKSQVEKHAEPGHGGDVRMINGMKLVPLNQMRKRIGDDQMRSRATDHDYSNVDPLEEEGVDPLEGLDPYEDEGVDPLAEDDQSTPIILDDCPDVPHGDDDVIDISSLCQAQVEG